jgi:hypothetical protein
VLPKPAVILEQRIVVIGNAVCRKILEFLPVRACTVFRLGRNVRARVFAISDMCRRTERRTRGETNLLEASKTDERLRPERSVRLGEGLRSSRNLFRAARRDGIDDMRLAADLAVRKRLAIPPDARILCL